MASNDFSDQICSYIDEYIYKYKDSRSLEKANRFMIRTDVKNKIVSYCNQVNPDEICIEFSTLIIKHYVLNLFKEGELVAVIHCWPDPDEVNVTCRRIN